jgi:hypothetical protein
MYAAWTNVRAWSYRCKHYSNQATLNWHSRDTGNIGQKMWNEDKQKQKTLHWNLNKWTIRIYQKRKPEWGDGILNKGLELEAIDANTTQTRLRWSYIEVIATTMLWKSTRTGWPLRNIHFSNNNGSKRLPLIDIPRTQATLDKRCEMKTNKNKKHSTET